MRFLLLTLYAPLASWGEITVGENRGSWDRPSRSAILGLVAAALGLTRDDQHAHDRLDRELGYAVRLDAPGVSVIDFHTVQTANEANLRKTFGRGRPTTRREVLSVAELRARRPSGSVEKSDIYAVCRSEIQPAGLATGTHDLRSAVIGSGVPSTRARASGHRFGAIDASRPGLGARGSA